MTYYVWVRNLDYGGTPYISDELPEAEMRAKVNTYEGGDDYFDRLRVEEVFTRGEMEADPALAVALAAWDRGDHSVWARDLAQYVFSETGPNAPSNGFTVHPPELAVLKTCPDLPDVAAALRIIELLGEAEALADKFWQRREAKAL